ncbi:ATP-binding cassette domain-containing protein [Pseudoalteromonas sp. B62]|uniref:ATP-binding cassette domain-containing protein n=1 Tax=Pseudoalteromonas sp. B62 TaxID=630483 RepID=UPI003FA74007
MTPGELIAFIMVLLLMSYSFASISDINTIYIKTINAVNNLNSLLRLDNFKDKIKPIEKSKLSNKIEIIDLSFTYQQSMLKSLSHISYTFITNNVYSIVGRSGSGKSTLTKLIAGLYCSYEGSLRISNQEVRTIQSRRDKIVTMVEQEPFFFSGTIWENITLEPNYSKVDEVKLNESLKLSNFDSVMKSNDFTFYDNIESNISNLSGGEKQRLAIARALYADTPILLLDEATNSLDSATESNFYSNFNEIAKDKVVLIITHNLNNIYLADKVVVLDDGKIVASEAPNHIINNEHFKKVSEYTKQFKMEHLK